MINKFLFLLFLIPAALFLAAVVFFIVNITKHRNKNLYHKLFWPTIFTFLSIFTLRFLTSFFYSLLSIEGNTENSELNCFEMLLNIIVRAFQTFSLDEEYLPSIIIGKQLFLKVFNSKYLADIYGFLAAITNVMAPVFGGAVILGILTNIFPRLSLRFKPFREKYIFSELNERAIYLAEDLVKHIMPKNKLAIPPLIVFTDAYIDKDREEPSELLQRAKKIGAICIKDDILQLNFCNTKRLWYILIDEVDINNIHTLTALTTKNVDTKDKKKSGKKTKYIYWRPKVNAEKKESENPKINIYIFSQNGEVSSIVKSIYEADKKNKKEDRILSDVVIKVVQEYTSIAYNLFEKIPLYKPLINKYNSGQKEEKELVLTIIGSGLIGTEIFLCAYWCGQLLNYKLKINVIDKYADKFKDKINLINPQILQSGNVLEKKDDSLLHTQPNKDLLRIFPNQNEYSEPYADFYFINADVETDSLLNVLCEDNYKLLKSDYFVVTVGNDELNMTTAANINRIIQKKYLDVEPSYDKRQPVIAYSVYDPNTKDVLNYIDKQNGEVELHAFASLKDIYSYNNIFMKDISDKAYNFSKTHTRKDMEEFLKDEYSWWSSIARSYHLKYKMFSIGLIFDEENKDTETEYKNIVSNIEKTNISTVGNKKIINYFLKIARKPEIQEKCGNLLWLEHRRWNAFMRTKGFVNPSEEQWYKYAYTERMGVLNHKHLNLKLHPCIVECSKNLFQISDSDWDSKDFRKNRLLDYLDRASIMVYQHPSNPNGIDSENPKKRDFKNYDDPCNDFKT